jgi:hypothetical protein
MLLVRTRSHEFVLLEFSGVKLNCMLPCAVCAMGYQAGRAAVDMDRQASPGTSLTLALLSAPCKVLRAVAGGQSPMLCWV